jgi:hypothetical protein
MSHFNVAVITKPGGKTAEELLQPFHEYECTGINDEYIEDIDKTEEHKSTWENHYKEEYPTFKEYLESEEICILDNKDEINKDDEDQMWGYAYTDENGEWHVISRTNPNARWDWYQIGGRWSGLLPLKRKADGSWPEHRTGERSWTMAGESEREGYADAAKIKNVLWKVNPRSEEYKYCIRFWELYIDKQTPQNEAEEDMAARTFFKESYYINRYKNKDAYAQRQCEISTYAVITPDGEWHSKGEMGWFGSSSSSTEEELEWSKNFYTAFIKDRDPEHIITIVDCHI